MSDELQEVKVLRVEPGDTLVLESPRRISDSELERIREQMKRQFPQQKLLVLESGMTIKKLTVEELEAHFANGGSW